MKSGFTLIELLVVVLIIGILAAVALPQYEKAVDKSRAMEGLMGLKTITDSMNLYFLENGKYPNNFAMYSGTTDTAFNDLTVVPPIWKYGGYAYYTSGGYVYLAATDLRKNFILRNYLSNGRVTSSCCSGDGCVYFPDWSKCS